jgi:membrane protease YdiL (CAAX protease family)
LKFGKKYLAITIVVIFLIIPIFFGIYIDFLLVSELSIGILLFLLIGFAILLGLGKLMEILMYNPSEKVFEPLSSQLGIPGTSYRIQRGLINGKWAVRLLKGNSIIDSYVFRDEKSKELMKQHDVVKALINGNDRIVLLVFLPLTMIMEEFIFRYYLIGILLNELKLGLILAVLISSVIFSLYHLHIWFKFKNLKILISYLISSFLLAIYNGYLLITLGIFVCIIVHTILVFILYYNLYKKLS